MSNNGNRYAIAALKQKRGSLASDIIQTNDKLRQLKSSLHSVDATLRILDPSVELGAIPTKRPRKKVKLYRQGELSRLVRGALREAGNQPISIHDIVSTLMELGGHSEESRVAIRARVRSNLCYLEKQGVVRKSGEQKMALWRLSQL